MKTFNDPEAFARVKRLPDAFATTERLRDGAVAAGVDVIDFSRGHPDTAAPAPVVEALRGAAVDPRYHRHLNPRGIPELRRAAASWLRRRRGIEVDPEREVIATLGTKDGIGHALVALLQEGDHVLVPAPSHPVHGLGPLLAGGETIPVRVGPGIDFMESLVVATEKAERRPRGIIVNFPANPTAAVATPELLQKLVKFAEARDLFILSDATYCDLVFEGPPAPLFLEFPGARERTLEFVSLSKSYDMPGFRIGFAAGNHALISALARVKGCLDHGPFGPVQAAGAVALAECDLFPGQVRDRYRARRDALVRHFGAAGWRIAVPVATPYAWTPIPDAVRHIGAQEFARRLLEEEGVAVAPGAGFGPGGEGHVRLALIQDEQRIQQAAERVARLLARVAAEPRPQHTPVPRSGERT